MSGMCAEISTSLAPYILWSGYVPEDERFYRLVYVNDRRDPSCEFLCKDAMGVDRWVSCQGQMVDILIIAVKSMYAQHFQALSTPSPTMVGQMSGVAVHHRKRAKKVSYNY